MRMRSYPLHSLIFEVLKAKKKRVFFKAKQILIRILKFGKDFDADVWLQDLRLNFDQMNSKVEIWY